MREFSSQTLFKMIIILSTIPLSTEESRKLKLLPIPTVMKHINAVEDDTDEQILEQLGKNEVETSHSLIFKAKRYCNSRFSYRKLAGIRQAHP